MSELAGVGHLERVLARIRDAQELQRLRQARRWRPIDTAPRDGTVVLATWADSWGLAITLGEGPRFAACEYGERWLYSDGGDPIPPHDLPTHWVPLLESP